jgi:hypothetical protein
MSMLKKIEHSFTLIKSTKASRCQGAPVLCRSDDIFKNCKTKPTTQRVTVETAGTECCNLFGQPSRHAASIARSCSMHTSQSVGKLAHPSPDSRHPGGVGERPRSAPLTPCFSPTRFWESAWPPLYSIKSYSWSRTSRNRRGSRCSRGSGRARGATAEPAQVEWRRHSQSITVFEVGTKQPVLTGLKRKLRPLALGCLVPTFSYPDLCVFDELRSTRPTPDEKTFQPFP